MEHLGFDRDLGFLQGLLWKYVPNHVKHV
jgi:hypothetical protein